MSNCKSCGEWFVSSGHAELCMSCERALKRLGKYAAPVVRGRWIGWEEAGNFIECSVCHDIAKRLCNGYDLLSPYCPNCGAKMDKEEF